MADQKQNYYGSLCTEMYELLHAHAPVDELEFYLSYARAGERILEPMCGSGRFLIPFMERGFDISGVDASAEMLDRLREKAADARAVQADLTTYAPPEQFDYIFIPSGSVSLFTDMELCMRILANLKAMLRRGGKFVFAVDTVSARCPDDSDYRTAVSVQTREGLELVLKTKNRYDAQSQTQFSPGYYELYRGQTLLEREYMDFQTHLYRFGEMEARLMGLGFTVDAVYSSFQKEIAVDDCSEILLFECSVQ